MAAAIKKLPAAERAWTDYFDQKGRKRFVLTSTQTRDWYFLYEIKDGGFVRLGKERTPSKLEERFQVEERMRNPDD